MTSNSIIEAPLDFIVKQGDTFYRKFEFQNEDFGYLDLTGYEFKLTIRDNANAELKTFDNADFVLASTGIYEITKAWSDVSIIPGEHKYDLQVTYPGGSITKTWLSGKFLIVNEVTVTP